MELPGHVHWEDQPSHPGRALGERGNGFLSAALSTHFKCPLGSREAARI